MIGTVSLNQRVAGSSPARFTIFQSMSQPHPVFRSQESVPNSVPHPAHNPPPLEVVHDAALRFHWDKQHNSLRLSDESIEADFGQGSRQRSLAEVGQRGEDSEDHYRATSQGTIQRSC